MPYQARCARRKMSVTVNTSTRPKQKLRGVTKEITLGTEGDKITYLMEVFYIRCTVTHEVPRRSAGIERLGVAPQSYMGKVKAVDLAPPVDITPHCGRSYASYALGVGCLPF